MQATVKFLAALAFSLLGGTAHAQELSLYCEEDKPLQFYNAQGKLTGVTVEIVEEIQNRLSSTASIQVVPWSRGIEMLYRNPNTMLFTMARTPERESQYQ